MRVLKGVLALVFLVLLPSFALAGGERSMDSGVESRIEALNPEVSTYKDALEQLVPYMTSDPGMLEKARKGLGTGLYDRIEEEKTELFDRTFSGAGEVLKFHGVKRGLNSENSGETYRATDGGLMSDEKLYILVSSSVPLVTLRNYARDLDALGEERAYMVIRGFIGGGERIRPTLEFIRKVVLKDADCRGRNCEAWNVRMDIDPRIFRKYGVDLVPAVIYETGGGDAYLLQGDISLEGAMLEINRRVKSSKLDCIALKLRIGPHGGCAERHKEEE